MTFNNLAQNLVKWGFEIKPHHHKAFNEYVYTMLKKDRVMVIWNNGSIEAIIFYFLTDDYVNLYKKSTWVVPQDDPQGHQMYIDKMVCRHWNTGLRRAVELAINRRFPDVFEVVYHRAPNDRCVKILTEAGKLCPKI